jgi:hypothetical protein
MTTIEQFESIIRQETPKELVPFLIKLEKAEVPAAREKLKNLRKELDVLVEVSPNHWGSRGTYEQFENIFLAGFAVYSRREALGGAISSGWLIGAHPNTKPILLKQHFLALVSALRPDWLHDWLLRQQTAANEWAVDYQLLRALEQEQLIPFSPTLTARSLPNALARWGWDLSTSVSIPQNAMEVITANLSRDELFLTRDLPLVFEFDNPIPNMWARIQPFMPLNQKGEEQNGQHLYPWQVWNQKHPIQTVNWHKLITHLTATHHLDRADILTRCLLALRRDFRRPLLTWFKELFLSLKPTRAERLARQDELTELLAHPLPLVVNFAIEQVKDLLPEPGFTLAPLLQMADTLLLRPDLKTGLKTLLAGLAKLPQQEAAHAPAVARLLAAALAHPEAAVQERAAKALADLLAAKKPLLSPAATAETLATLADQAALLAPAARAALAPWLAAPTPPPAAEAAAAYAPLAQFVPDISPATAIAPVADWHELLFLTGQVLRHDDPTALERWLDGLLRLHGQLPEGHAAQLEPYLVQVLPQLKKTSLTEKAALLAGPIAIWGHEGLTQALVLSWANGFATLRVPDVEVTATHYARTPLLALDKQRYAQAEQLLRQGQSLPLLSTPTHSPNWVAPTLLVTKLLAYQQANTEPAVADLLLALARTAHAHPAEAVAALRLLPQLHRAELRELLAWYFGPTLEVPVQVAYPARRPAGLDAPLATALPELWAVAARTKAPTHVFPTLPARLGYDYAGVAQPLRPMPEVTTGENHYQQWQLPGQPTATYRWTEVHWSSEADGPPPSPLLVYSPPAAKTKEGHWEHNLLLKSDFQFLASLLPNYPAPLYEYVLRSAAWADNLESSERDLVAQALHALLGPGPTFDRAASALLASGLIHHAPICRSLGQEVLVQAIANGRVAPVYLGQILGQQLAIGYAPLARLADSLPQLRAISPETDDALAQILDALLPALPALPPRNLRKLLDAYADLVARTGRQVPPAVQVRLREWCQTAAFKKLAGSLLK